MLLLNVGKASSHHLLPQDQINRLIADKALEGKIVTRLKGGDPYVFGRGGEEGELLKAEGIEFEVVPGVTSAIGGLCYAGIPITHRDHASSFHVITGHLRKDGKENPEINWNALDSGLCLPEQRRKQILPAVCRGKCSEGPSGEKNEVTVDSEKTQ